MTISTLATSHELGHVARGLAHQVHGKNTLAEGGGYLVLVVAAGQFAGYGKGKVDAEFSLVQIGQIVDKGQRAARVDEADVGEYPKLCTTEHKMP